MKFRDAATLCLRLKRKGFQCYIVGGAVRDMELGKLPHDYDLATDATPQQISKVFSHLHVIPTGEKFGTMTVMYKGEPYQITTFRADVGSTDKRRPDSVRYTKSLEEDLMRRDFTINSMGMNAQTGEIIDPFHGIRDIKRKVIRTVGDPNDRFSEDYLRMMRACRFQSRLGFKIEPKTKLALMKHAPKISKISSERIRDEILGIMVSSKPSVGIDSLEKVGLLKRVLPEVSKMVDVDQKSAYHTKNVYKHTLDVVDRLPASDPILRMAGLLHDIGKPKAKKFSPEKGRYMFIGHEDISAIMARKCLRRLNFSSADINRIINIIDNHMFNYSTDWTDATIRRWINKVGINNVADLILFKRADSRASRVSCDAQMDELESRIKNMSSPVVSKRSLAISGHDVMQALNIPPSHIVGKKLKILEEMVIEDPSLNTREQLLALLEDI